MYAVILAGGGGTRLHPLSRPERPKPFLPLLDERSLLQRTVARLAGLTDDITVVTDRRYERLVKEQVPDAALVLEPLGRNTAAAIALATLAIERPDDEVMVVLPADQTVERDDVFRTVLRTAADRLATGAFGIEEPLVTLGIEVDRPATDYGYLIPDLARGADVDGLRAYPLVRFEEKPKPARADELAKLEGVAWNAGIFLWRRRAIRAALGRYTGLLQSLGPMVGSAGQPRARVRGDPAAGLDRLRGDGGRGPERPGRDGLDGRRLVRSRLVDRAAGGDRRRAGPGRSSRPARPSRSSTTT